MFTHLEPALPVIWIEPETEALLEGLEIVKALLEDLAAFASMLPLATVANAKSSKLLAPLIRNCRDHILEYNCIMIKLPIDVIVYKE